ncbi:MAG TPA: hypothetical protein DD738_13330, partial [Ruminiclostridium sp.]|nr:hypothetical protein [Ruminiclostridium sp.]
MKNIIFIGDVALDEYYKAEYFPQIKEKVGVETLPAQTGGMIANAAAVYASYTDGVEFCGVLNSGAVSKMLCEDLNASNVGTRFVMTDNRLADSKVIIILAEDEHTVFIPNINVTEIPLTDEAYYALLQADWV